MNCKKAYGEFKHLDEFLSDKDWLTDFDKNQPKLLTTFGGYIFTLWAAVKAEATKPDEEELLDALAGMVKAYAEETRNGRAFFYDTRLCPFRGTSESLALDLLFKHGKLREADGRYEWVER